MSDWFHGILSYRVRLLIGRYSYEAFLPTLPVLPDGTISSFPTVTRFSPTTYSFVFKDALSHATGSLQSVTVFAVNMYGWSDNAEVDLTFNLASPPSK